MNARGLMMVVLMLVASPFVRAQEVTAGRSTMLGPVEDLRYTELRSAVNVILQQYKSTIQNVMNCQAEKKFWDGTGCVASEVPINTPIDRPYKTEWRYIDLPAAEYCYTYAASFCSATVDLSAYVDKSTPKIIGTCYGGWCSFGPYLATGTTGEVSFDFNVPAAGTIVQNGNGEKTHYLQWTYDSATKRATFNTRYSGSSTMMSMRYNGFKNMKLAYTVVVFTK
jgi:hypothetical protein